MATLLLELFSEEIPSRMQRGACEQLQRLIAGGFEKAGLALGEVKTFVSPRHLAIQIAGLPLVQPDVSEEKKGPKLGAPEQAMAGFLKSVGLTAEQCEQRDGYYFAVIHKKGQPVAQVAKTVVEDALNAFVWPKSMQWGDSKARPMRWVRPLHRIACLLDDAIIPAQFGHLTASDKTQGHRFLAPAVITLTHAEKYEEQLQAANIVVDPAKRRDWIATEIASLAKAHNLTVVNDPALLDEVTGLVEWPVPLLGTFDAHFLDLPPEVLISEMKVHQRYFALTDASGKLANQFITVANISMDDAMRATIADGNARVLRARLSDGAFYWEQDKKTNLEDWGKKLADVVFHAKVGMMNEKVARIEALAATIAREVGFTDTASVARTARLAKADLTSGMVGEFPELQGIMGRYYATAQGESPEVADAIRDHYKPVGATDSVPETTLAAIVGVADKLDSILSLFAAGEKPTGSKDPLALRRAALGILRTILQHGWNLDLASLIRHSRESGNLAAHANVKIPASAGMTWDMEVIEFFRDRLKTMLKDDGVRHDIIEASFAVKAEGFNPAAIVANAKALNDFTAKQQATLAAIKRALNILSAEEKKAKTHYRFASAKHAHPAEQALHDVLAQPVVSLDALAGLAAPINQFFTDLLVTEEGHRDARLGLLAGVRERTNQFADFSKIEG